MKNGNFKRNSLIGLALVGALGVGVATFNTQSTTDRDAVETIQNNSATYSNADEQDQIQGQDQVQGEDVGGYRPTSPFSKNEQNPEYTKTVTGVSASNGANVSTDGGVYPYKISYVLVSPGLDSKHAVIYQAKEMDYPVSRYVMNEPRFEFEVLKNSNLKELGIVRENNNVRYIAVDSFEHQVRSDVREALVDAYGYMKRLGADVNASTAQVNKDVEDIMENPAKLRFVADQLIALKHVQDAELPPEEAMIFGAYEVTEVKIENEDEHPANRIIGDFAQLYPVLEFIKAERVTNMDRRIAEGRGPRELDGMTPNMP